jgi:hypothetical protein
VQDAWSCPSTASAYIGTSGVLEPTTAGDDGPTWGQIAISVLTLTPSSAHTSFASSVQCTRLRQSAVHNEPTAVAIPAARVPTAVSYCYRVEYLDIHSIFTVNEV